MTLDGTDADFALDVSLMTFPPVAAGPLSETVPLELLPPTTEDGFRTSPESPAGLTVSVATLLEVPAAAVRVTEVVLETGKLVVVKVTLFCPAGTFTLAGAEAVVALLELSFTLKPAFEAALLNVTVPVDFPPPTRLVGLSFNDEILWADATKQLAARQVKRLIDKTQERRHTNIISNISCKPHHRCMQVYRSRIVPVDQ